MPSLLAALSSLTSRAAGSHVVAEQRQHHAWQFSTEAEGNATDASLDSVPFAAGDSTVLQWTMVALSVVGLALSLGVLWSFIVPRLRQVQRSGRDVLFASMLLACAALCGVNFASRTDSGCAAQAVVRAMLVVVQVLLHGAVGLDALKRVQHTTAAVARGNTVAPTPTAAIALTTPPTRQSSKSLSSCGTAPSPSPTDTHRIDVRPENAADEGVVAIAVAVTVRPVVGSELSIVATEASEGLSSSFAWKVSLTSIVASVLGVGALYLAAAPTDDLAAAGEVVCALRGDALPMYAFVLPVFALVAAALLYINARISSLSREGVEALTSPPLDSTVEPVRSNLRLEQLDSLLASRKASGWMLAVFLCGWTPSILGVVASLASGSSRSAGGLEVAGLLAAAVHSILLPLACVSTDSLFRAEVATAWSSFSALATRCVQGRMGPAGPGTSSSSQLRSAGAAAWSATAASRSASGVVLFDNPGAVVVGAEAKLRPGSHSRSRSTSSSVGEDTATGDTDEFDARARGEKRGGLVPVAKAKSYTDLRQGQPAARSAQKTILSQPPPRKRSVSSRDGRRSPSSGRGLLERGRAHSSPRGSRVVLLPGVAHAPNPVDPTAARSLSPLSRGWNSAHARERGDGALSVLALNGSTLDVPLRLVGTLGTLASPTRGPLEGEEMETMELPNAVRELSAEEAARRSSVSANNPPVTAFSILSPPRSPNRVDAPLSIQASSALKPSSRVQTQQNNIAIIEWTLANSKRIEVS